MPVPGYQPGKYYDRGPWNKQTRAKEGTSQWHVYGHDDPEVQECPESLQVKMDNWLAGFPASHWRDPVGGIKIGRYQSIQDKNKKNGQMVYEPDSNGNLYKFNIIMDANDPITSSIGKMYERLQACPLLAIGSSQREMTFATKKDSYGVHAGEHDILFRTMKMCTYAMGYTMHGDRSNSGADKNIRHAWIKTMLWSTGNSTRQGEMANLLCIFVGYRPQYPGCLGGNIPSAPSHTTLGCSPPRHDFRSLVRASGGDWPGSSGDGQPSQKHAPESQARKSVPSTPPMTSQRMLTSSDMAGQSSEHEGPDPKLLPLPPWRPTRIPLSPAEADERDQRLWEQRQALVVEDLPNGGVHDCSTIPPVPSPPALDSQSLALVPSHPQPEPSAFQALCDLVMAVAEPWIWLPSKISYYESTGQVQMQDPSTFQWRSLQVEDAIQEFSSPEHRDTWDDEVDEFANSSQPLAVDGTSSHSEWGLETEFDYWVPLFDVPGTLEEFVMPDVPGPDSGQILTYWPAAPADHQPPVGWAAVGGQANHWLGGSGGAMVPDGQHGAVPWAQMTTMQAVPDLAQPAVGPEPWAGVAERFGDITPRTWVHQQACDRSQSLTTIQSKAMDGLGTANKMFFRQVLAQLDSLKNRRVRNPPTQHLLKDISRKAQTFDHSLNITFMAAAGNQFDCDWDAVTKFSQSLSTTEVAQPDDCYGHWRQVHWITH
jgi:hypothetical protein